MNLKADKRRALTLLAGLLLCASLIVGSLQATAVHAAPAAQEQDAACCTYIVEPGDSVASIAAKFGMSVEEVRTLNNLGAHDFIFVGQELRVTGQAIVETPEADKSNAGKKPHAQDQNRATPTPVAEEEAADEAATATPVAEEEAADAAATATPAAEEEAADEAAATATPAAEEEAADEAAATATPVAEEEAADEGRRHRNACR